MTALRSRVGFSEPFSAWKATRRLHGTDVRGHEFPGLSKCLEQAYPSTRDGSSKRARTSTSSFFRVDGRSTGRVDRSEDCIGHIDTTIGRFQAGIGPHARGRIYGKSRKFTVGANPARWNLDRSDRRGGTLGARCERLGEHASIENRARCDPPHKKSTPKQPNVPRVEEERGGPLLRAGGTERPSIVAGRRGIQEFR